jgi:hypothetical protein
MDTATEPAQICAGVFRHSGTVACEEGEATHLLLRRYRLPGRTQKVGKGEQEVHLYEDLLDQYQHRLEDIDECVPDGNNPENLPRPDDESSAAGDDQEATRGTQPPAVKWKNRRQCTPQSRARARFKGSLLA